MGMVAPASPHAPLFSVKRPTPTPTPWPPPSPSSSSPQPRTPSLHLFLPPLYPSPPPFLDSCCVGSLASSLLRALCLHGHFLSRLERGEKVERGMGSCASVHKDPGGFPKKLFLASPHKAKAANGKGGGGVAPVGDGGLGDPKCKIEGEQQRAGFAPKSPDSGSKDEMFFESRAWLDSDCEDDFYSVNGDFTPSRGSTPNYQPRTQTVMTSVFQLDSIHNPKSSEPSPTGRRKLAELLQEPMHNASEESTDIGKNEQQQMQSIAAGKSVSKSSSACCTEPTPIRIAKGRKERAWYTGRCCLPSFVHSLTVDESESRQRMNPGPCAV